MTQTVDSSDMQVTAIVSPLDNINHPDHPHHNDEVSNPLLLAAVLKGTPLLTGAIVATGCAYIGLNDPESKQIFPVCAFYAMTGLYCPGCGMTRALHSLLGGNILRAIRYNVMLVIAMPVLIYAYLWWVNWTFTGKELPKLKFPKPLIWAICISAVIFVVGRNLPGDIASYFALGK